MSTLQERLTRFNVLYLLGLLLAIGGCNGVFLLEGKLVYVTILVYVTGLGLAWFSGVDTFYRLMALLLPAVVFISVYTVTHDDRVREPAIWLIPEGYGGPVYVFFKESCGTPEEREEEARIYRPDLLGRAFTRYDKNYGLDLTEPAFYYLSRDGKRSLLKNIRLSGPDSLRIQVGDPESGGQPVFAFPGIPTQGNHEYGKYYLEYAFIGTYSEYFDFIRTSPLPESAPEDLLREWSAFRDSCR